MPLVQKQHRYVTACQHPGHHRTNNHIGQPGFSLGTHDNHIETTPLYSGFFVNANMRESCGRPHMANDVSPPLFLTLDYLPDLFPLGGSGENHSGETSRSMVHVAGIGYTPRRELTGLNGRQLS